MDRIAPSIIDTLRLLPRAMLILMLFIVPVLAVPMMRADTEAPKKGVGFVLLVSLQRG
ncbi:hypothetical protein [Mesorhizobium sp. B1-1-8]|uniref:hypothetical protein n=1 Tax=Mesorhizobium sp. B1-1-8 TaxID=2589976 RepID=UPI0015E2C285|nr:hypothetical protein [Mesorhizobium sp. B1-1-8]UCI06739.1 hypothetical protein FJ974_23485 [Mesorhizobium sp. B1-1-8]